MADTSLTITYKPGQPEAAATEAPKAAPGPEGGGGDPGAKVLQTLYEFAKPLLKGLEAGQRQFGEATSQLNPLGRGTEGPVEAILRNLSGAMGLMNVPGAAVGGMVAAPLEDIPGGTYKPGFNIPGLGQRQWPSAAETVGTLGAALTPGGPKGPRGKGILTPREQGLVLPSAQARERLTQRAASGPPLTETERQGLRPVVQPKGEKEAQLGLTETLKRNRAMTAVEPKGVIVEAGEAERVGARRVQDTLQNMWRPFQEAALYLPATVAREGTLAAQGRARAGVSGLSHSVLREAYLRGLFGQYWYEGAMDELTVGIRRLAEAANQRQVKSALDLQKDPLRLAQMIASTSPRTEPGLNVDNAIRALLVWVAHGRPETGFSFTTSKELVSKKGKVTPARQSTSPHASFMPGHGENLGRATAAEPLAEPLSGLKVSNFLLDILGSQTAPTIDVWMARMLLGTEFNKTLPDWAYPVVAERLTHLANAWGTTPVRAQAALWTGYKLLHDERMIALTSRGLTDAQAVPNLATQIRGGIDRAIQSGGASTDWLRQGSMAALPVIGLAKILIENDNAYQERGVE